MRFTFKGYSLGLLLTVKADIADINDTGAQADSLVSFVSAGDSRSHSYPRGWLDVGLANQDRGSAKIVSTYIHYLYLTYVTLKRSYPQLAGLYTRLTLSTYIPH